MEMSEKVAARVPISTQTGISLSPTGNDAMTKWKQSVIYEDKFSIKEDFSRHI